MTFFWPRSSERYNTPQVHVPSTATVSARDRNALAGTHALPSSAVKQCRSTKTQDRRMVIWSFPRAHTRYRKDNHRQARQGLNQYFDISITNAIGILSLPPSLLSEIGLFTKESNKSTGRGKPSARPPNRDEFAVEHRLMYSSDSIREGQNNAR